MLPSRRGYSRFEVKTQRPAPLSLPTVFTFDCIELTLCPLLRRGFLQDGNEFIGRRGHGDRVPEYDVLGSEPMPVQRFIAVMVRMQGRAL